MKTIQTENAPAAIGPYSQALVAGGFLYTSGTGKEDCDAGENYDRTDRHAPAL